MRSHVTEQAEVIIQAYLEFQYRKRYEITCDGTNRYAMLNDGYGFNTASGMRSHVTGNRFPFPIHPVKFQYRKRYEITCDMTR